MSTDWQSHGAGSVLNDGSNSERASVPQFLSALRSHFPDLSDLFKCLDFSRGKWTVIVATGRKSVRISNLFFDTLILPYHPPDTVFLFTCLSLLLLPQEPLSNLRVKQYTFEPQKLTKPGTTVCVSKPTFGTLAYHVLLTIYPFTIWSNVLRSI